MVAAGLPDDVAPEDDDFLIEEFRRVPDDWKPVALEHVRMVAKLSNLPPARFVGEDDLPPEPEEPA